MYRTLDKFQKNIRNGNKSRIGPWILIVLWKSTNDILNLAISVQSQNSGFGGLPSSFSWIDKYQSPSFSNPFADDIFDPFQNPRHQSHSSYGTSKYFIALFSLFWEILFLLIDMLICWTRGNILRIRCLICILFTFEHVWCSVPSGIVSGATLQNLRKRLISMHWGDDKRLTCSSLVVVVLPENTSADVKCVCSALFFAEDIWFCMQIRFQGPSVGCRIC